MNTILRVLVLLGVVPISVVLWNLTMLDAVGDNITALQAVGRGVFTCLLGGSVYAGVVALGHKFVMPWLRDGYDEDKKLLAARRREREQLALKTQRAEIQGGSLSVADFGQPGPSASAELWRKRARSISE